MGPGQLSPRGDNRKFPGKLDGSPQYLFVDTQVPGQPRNHSPTVIRPFPVRFDVIVDMPAGLPVSEDFFALDPSLTEEKSLANFVAEGGVICETT